MAHSCSIKLVAALIAFTIQVSAKNNARPVYEVINEQARMDDIRLSSAPAILPYGNPLAGNSAQNARLHASNQQAMFNAERIRQHKAQLQRLAQGPPILDSYMKAYHESQESHQLELEQQQSNIKEDPTTTPAPNPRKQIRVRIPQNSKQRISQSSRDQVRNVNRAQNKRRTNVESDKINRSNNQDRNRNHRSYDSVEYQKYLNSKSGYAQIEETGFDEGVTIKPNGNIGVAHEQEPASSNIQARSITASGKYIPKNHNYQTVQEINALELLLRKNPVDQLSEFKTLLNAGKLSENDNAQAPLDLYYYFKDPESAAEFGQTYTQVPISYTSDFVKDHTPITEEIDEIQDPPPQNNFFTPQLPTEAPTLETSTLQTNYYKVEVASQTVSSGFKPSKINEELFFNDDNPAYQTVHYGNQPTAYYKDVNSENNLSDNYSHQGVQHLNDDGTGVSAYGIENVSIHGTILVRNKRSELDVDPFLIPSVNKTLTDQISSNDTELPKAEALRRPINKKRNDFNIFLTPSFQIGEASDYIDEYDDFKPKLKRPVPKFETLDEDDYNSYDDFTSSDYEFEATKSSPVRLADQPLQNSQSDSKGSFSNRYSHFQQSVELPSSLYGIPPSTSYGVPIYPQSISPAIKLNLQSTLPNVLEPVYMLTQSQLKELIGHHNLNIEHLDVYHLSKDKKSHYPRRYRKRYPSRHRNIRNNLHKLHKLKVV